MVNKGDPLSLKNCDDGNMSAIQDYRQHAKNYLEAIRNSRTDVGVWSPACVKHCFAHTYAFNSNKYTVNGITLYTALIKFIQQPKNAPWLMD